MLISGLQPRSEPSLTTRPIELVALSRASCWRVFLILFGVALAYTCYTGHVWEDYYITFRASKNLATGHGFVFNPGERVHSFTSPLGALLPAVAMLMTGNSSDDGALWIFRMMSMSAYAGAGVLLWRLARGLFRQVYPAVFLVLLLATDAKSIDTATNGMESAFVLLFMVWNLWALFCSPPRRAIYLGLAWAGLMWSRPDSFIYIGVSAMAVVLFGRFENRWADRRELIRDYLVGGILTTAIYGPWILWAWSYYGSPIPHTIIAKGVWMQPITAHNLWQWITQFPVYIFKSSSILGTTFTPPYAMNTGWPALPIRISAGLSLLVMAVWLLPFLRWEARVTSFVFTVGQFYLTYMANFPAPWYLPIVTMLGFFTLASVVGQILQALSQRKAGDNPAPHRAHRGIAAVTLLLPVGGLLLVFGSAWEMRVHQTIIENEIRRPIGEWLKANASSPRDTVVMECLGYIGFYSNLKIYDYPGLSSPEVVKVLRETKTKADYTHYIPEIVSAYNPDWIVLRAGNEVGEFISVDRELLNNYYHLAKVYDRRDAIEAIKFLPGRGYAMFDARFEVYHRNEALPDVPGLRDSPSALRHRVSLATLTTNRAWGEGKAYLNDGRILAHAPSELTTPIPAGATQVIGEFGLYPGAYLEHPTPGARFTVNAVSSGGKRTPIYSRLLNPVQVAGDRGQQFFAAPITVPNATTAEFVIEPPGQGNAFCWTYWTNLRFNVPEAR